MIPGTPKDLARAAEIPSSPARCYTCILHKTYHVYRQLTSIYSHSNHAEASNSKAQKLPALNRNASSSFSKSRYALIIILLSRYVHDRVTISIPIFGCPNCASRYIAIILMCSIKRKSGQGKGYIVARGGSIGFSEGGLNPIWVVDL